MFIDLLRLSFINMVSYFTVVTIVVVSFAGTFFFKDKLSDE